MTQHRFFINDEAQPGHTVAFLPGDARQMKTVLRLRPGDRVTAVTPSGEELEVELCSAGLSEGVVLSSRKNVTEPSLKVVLAPALIKGDRLDWVIQKSTELGAAAILPWEASRSVVKPDPGKISSRVSRWRSIAKEAAEQSRRGQIPDVLPPADLETALAILAEIQPDGAIFLPWEGEFEQSLRSAFDNYLRERGQASVCRIAVFTGPEGGLTEAEVTRLRRAGARTVSLGARILRAETAALTALVLLLGQAGDLDAGGQRF